MLPRPISSITAQSPKQLLLPAGDLAGRGLLGRQPCLQPCRRLVQVAVEALLEGQPALVLAGSVDERVGQDAAQPGRLLTIPAAAELVPPLVRLDESLLHHVGRVELAAQPRIELEASQQVQVIPVGLQGLPLGLGHHCPTQKDGGRGTIDRATPVFLLRRRERSTKVAGSEQLAPVVPRMPTSWPAGA
jgi:hypothetical protein